MITGSRAPATSSASRRPGGGGYGDDVERVAAVAVDGVELGNDVEALSVEHQPARSRAAGNGYVAGAEEANVLRSRRSYGRFFSVSATWPGGAAAM